MKFARKSIGAMSGLLGMLMAAGSAWADVTIGVAGPISGSSAAFGDQLLNGVKVAVDELNGSGGILGQKVLIKIGDDKGTQNRGCRLRIISRPTISNSLSGHHVFRHHHGRIRKSMPRTAC